MSDAVISPVLPAIDPVGGDPSRVEGLREAAEEFEAIFLAQVLQTMTQGLGGDDLLAGGQNDVFRDMLSDEVAKLISRTGGVGVADAVLKEMLKTQEIA